MVIIPGQIRNKTVNTGITIPYDVFARLELERQKNFESRSHLYSRLLSAALDKKEKRNEKA